MLREIAMATARDVVRFGEVVPATAIYRLPSGNVWSEFKGSANEPRDLLCSVVADMNRMAEDGLFPEEYVVFAQLRPEDGCGSRVFLVWEDQDHGLYCHADLEDGRLGPWTEGSMGPHESLFYRPPRRMEG